MRFVLLVESGIHIIECLNLEELASSGAKEFSVCRLAAEDSRQHRLNNPVALVVQ